MIQPGLDGRHRDADGEISRKHGNTLVGTLRQIYGHEFASGFPETAKLKDVLEKLHETSLSQLRKHHHDGSLAAKINAAEQSAGSQFDDTHRQGP